MLRCGTSVSIANGLLSLVFQPSYLLLHNFMNTYFRFLPCVFIFHFRDGRPCTFSVEIACEIGGFAEKVCEVKGRGKKEMKENEAARYSTPIVASAAVFGSRLLRACTETENNM